jgi:NADH:ubiquinone oxidoreductase subunit 5 (subunit L)/multisubunit Na+/H+ antiporter MnhA subunit
MTAFVLAAGFGVWLSNFLYLQNPKLRARLTASFPRLNALFAHNFHADGIVSALLIDRAKDLSLSVAVFDEKFLDGFLIRGSAILTRIVSQIAAWFDDAVVDGLAVFFAKSTGFLSVPFRMLQTGRASAYAALVVLGFVMLLGYYGYHMQHWVQHLH